MSQRQLLNRGALIGCRALILAASLVQLSAAGNGSLYDSIGGEPVLKSVVNEFTNIVIDDDRINFTFAQSDLDKFKRLLFEQLCEITGGPCHYSGRDMRTAHAKLKIDDAEFNALAEDLYIAFEHAHVPYRLQNKVMALLAPMHRDIVK
jgi:hemoglobin